MRRRPQCAECGDSGLLAARVRAPVVIGPVAKSFACGAGHRAVPPEQLLGRYRHLISPVTGIVKDVTPVDGPAFVHAYRSGPNVAANVATHSCLPARDAARNAVTSAAPARHIWPWHAGRLVGRALYAHGRRLPGGVCQPRSYGNGRPVVTSTVTRWALPIRWMG